MAKSINDIESKLWAAADTLRGNMSAEEYMHTILGILSLKYISDRNLFGIKKLSEEGLSLDFVEPEEFYYRYNAFIVPEKASWNYVMKFANSPSLGEVIDNAFIELEDNNEMLRGIFNKNFNKEGVDQIKLGGVIKIFSDEDFSHQEDEDIIGRIYEYFLGKFFRDRGQSGGEFYTPTSIVKLMVNLIKPVRGTIYDPACGSGGILVQSKRYIESHGGKMEDITAYGQEYNNVTWKLAKLNLVLNGFPIVDTEGNGVIGQRSADTFADDQHKNKKFDFVMANPPFNVKKWGAENLQEDPRFKWGIPPQGNANYAWLSHMVSKLSTKGKAAIVLANGSLSSSNQEKLMREAFVNDNKVDAIIELPDKLFYTTGIPACIWIFNNSKVNENILMINASKMEGNMISKKLRELKDEDIDILSKFYEKHQKGEQVNQLGVAKTITKNDLKDNDFSFVPGRYVGSEEEIIDKAELKEEIKKIAEELTGLLKEFSDMIPEVESSIKKALEYEE
ncbi:type I restriction enzyme M protein [Spiroplasma sabaudiense Ar-1343]|uniref:site-specific DNA-methyltransferase (adenine-specific) n=1 Tax=Spiroplasma sabaudiense Ar-1343 TaxID=1276257 RepID=W6AJD6_9MOLU|nr:class I SAM-dependent DNA methyltransferase [Spiroplasma sabaudiense]AHI53829.1 type I restriction enzyme M protein [Spiroplasma sabaudiense Ar-1343]